MFDGGLVWYVLPMTLITLNDIAAYGVGFFFGNTPLIEVNKQTTGESAIYQTFYSLTFLGSSIPSSMISCCQRVT
jgi:phosphatidate cytidylyltransferase